MPQFAEYVPSRWLRVPSAIAGHAQTIVPATLCPRPRVTYRRTRIDTPDGDFVDFDWLAIPSTASSAPVDAPLVILFHGLEGSSQSHYAVAMMHELALRSWHGVVPHFRGCSGEPNRLARAYHSGDSVEIAWMLQTLLTQHLKNHAHSTSSSIGPVYAVGVSLGGNALLKWLGEQGAAASSLVTRAAAVSAPVDLAAGGHALARGANRLYTRMFLQTLKAKSAAKLRTHPGAFDETAMQAARNLYEFDNVVTAPLHGFRDTNDYWARASALPWLKSIAVPTLVLNAKNDPFLPRAALPTTQHISASVTLAQPEHGGHVGFMTSLSQSGLAWLPEQLLNFLHPSPSALP